ncbi:MAG TPA: hypothetical protein VKE98_13370 [Gemmataceae bacterium]|nr:hypothetical protein [Gemmataceae bacterium]
MELHRLPQFPVQHEERLPEKDAGRPSGLENLSIIFEFGTGLALANIFLIASLMPFFALSALEMAILEAPFFFGIFGLLIVGSRLSFLEQAAESAYEEGSPKEIAALAPIILAGTALVVGAGIGIALGLGLASALSHWLGSLQGRLDHVIAFGLVGALVGFVGGTALVLAGGTPNWKVGRVFTALGKIIPALVRKSFFPKRRGEIRIRGKPWLEGIVWSGFVLGPMVFWLIR